VEQGRDIVCRAGAVKTVLQIFKHEDALCIDVTPLAKELGWEEGDLVDVIKSKNGIQIVSSELLNSGALRRANDFMKKYPKAMKRLAE
jgi:hypothetical protein